MRDSIIYNYIFKGEHDWRNFDAGVMEKVIAVNLILGLVANLTWNENIINIYQDVFLFSTLYFIVGPVVACYRNFKTDEYMYIFITPIKKLYVLSKTLSVWAIGFMAFVIVKILISLMRPGFVEGLFNGDIGYLFIQLINIALVIVSAYGVIISIDIITVVKKIPRLITYPIAVALIISRIYIPKFMVFSREDSYGFIGFMFNKVYSTGLEKDISTTVVGPSLVVFIVSFALFIYALSIFEGYNGERPIGLVKRFLIRK